MKTIKYLFFFGGFMLFFNFSRAYASPLTNGQATPINQLREQILTTFNHSFSSTADQSKKSVTVEFVVGPDHHLQVVGMSGGSHALKKLVKDKFAAIEANSTLANERYSVQLNFNLI